MTPEPRLPWSHKGDHGRLLIVGGSIDYVGAPALAGMAALYAGCDLCTIAAPENAAWAINCLSPDLITIKLKGERLTERNLAVLLEASGKCDAVLIGNGLGAHPSTLSAVQKFVDRVDKPLVLDADALKIKDITEGSILTPHAGEFFILSGEKPTTDLVERRELVRTVARKLGCIIILKGHVDIISDGNRVVENRTGNPYMTIGGTGDTLAGILGSLLVQGTPKFEAAVRAAEINGMAGDLCLKQEKHVLASKLLKYIPSVLENKR